MSKISVVTLHRVTGQETLKVLLPSLRPVNTFVNEVRRNLQFDILRASLITPPPYGHPRLRRTEHCTPLSQHGLPSRQPSEGFARYKQRGSLQGRAERKQAFFDILHNTDSYSYSRAASRWPCLTAWASHSGESTLMAAPRERRGVMKSAVGRRGLLFFTRSPGWYRFAGLPGFSRLFSGQSYG